jgi:ABC-type transport system substrate-binding protein
MKKTIVLIILSLLLVVSACSSSTNKSTSTQETAKKVPKDLIVALNNEPRTLDPQNGADSNAINILDLIYDKLVNFDKEMKIVPQLAKKWIFSKDGMKLTFILNEGITFQDGTAFNSEAVKKSFDRLLNKDNKLSNYSTFGEFIDNVVADNANQVTFNLKFPFGAALASFAHQAAYIISPKAIDEFGKNLNKNPVGTGPYKFVSWTPGDKVVVEANPTYWGEKQQINTFTFVNVPEDASRSIKLEIGEADIITPVPVADLERLKSSDKIKVSVDPSNLILYMGINTTNAPFNDPKVRQALNYAVDKETIAKKITLGISRVADSPIADTIWGHSNVGAYPYDPEKAKKLLAEAGVKQGSTIRLWTPDGRYFKDKQIAEFIQGNLKEIGFNVEFQKWDWASYLSALGDKTKKKDFDLFLIGWITNTNDADWAIRPIFKTGQDKDNNGQFSNLEVDALIEEGMKSINDDERKAQYKKLQEVLKEQAPWIFLVQMDTASGTSNNVDGVYGKFNNTLNLKGLTKK